VIITGGSIVQNNTAKLTGGGLHISGGYSAGSIVTISGGSIVQGNTAWRSGGGLCIRNNVSVTLTGGSTVQDNTAKEGGGGLDISYESSSRPVVVLTGGTRVQGNMALNGSGGGLRVEGAQSLTISQSTVLNNTCVGGVGGGIAVDSGVWSFTLHFDGRGRASAQFSMKLAFSSNVTISNSTISNNSAIGAAGGGLAVGDDGNVQLVDGTLVSRNSAINSSGGGVFLLGRGTLQADDSVVFTNNVVNKGYVGSTIVAFENSSLHLPHSGRLTKCSVGVYLGWSTCQAGEVLQHDMCVCCPQHTFSFTNASCEPCPSNGNCTGGSLLEPLPGYWSSAPTSVQMHHCPLSTTACNYTSPVHVCNDGYTGPLCGICKLPDFGMLSPFRCGKCMLPKVQLGLYVLTSCAVVAFVAVTVQTTWKDNLTADKEVLATDYIKVLVMFLQYTVIIGSVSVAWQLFDLQRWFQAVNIVFAVGSGQALSLDCWLYHYIPQGKLPLAMQRQLVYFLAAVVVLLAVVVLHWLSWAVWRWVVPLVWPPREGATQQPASLVCRKLPVTLLVTAYYALPTLARASASFFACLRIDRAPPEVQLPPGATAPLNHTWGCWVSDINQQCFSGYHKGWALGLGIPSVLLWCVAVPVPKQG
jgi:hypothetical protein